MKSMQERRKYVRLNKSVVVGYHVIDNYSGGDSSSKDISIGGLRIPVNQKLERGVVLDLAISLNKFDAPIKSIAQVIWISKRDDPGLPFEIGIRFVQIKPDDSKKLFGYIINN